jgi:transposase
MPDHAPVPQTVAELHALVLEQQASMAKMRQEIAERDREIVERDRELERLKAQIDKLRRMHFGRKSEQVDRQIDRLETQLEDLAAGSGVADVRRARARASSSGASATSAKEALPPHLPREDRVLEPDSICPKCDNAMDLLGEDVSEQLARITAMFKVIRTIRRKRICSSCDHIGQRPMPGMPIERSIAASELAGRDHRFEICEPYAAISAIRDRGARRRPSRSGHHGALGRAMRRTLPVGD